MSLLMPEALSFGDDGELSGEDEYVCSTSETLIAVIEKCLDNGLGTCLVVGEENRFVGRITLDDIGKAVLNGALLNPTLDRHIETFAHRLSNDGTADADVLRPVLDSSGNLVSVTVDRSTQRIQVARPDMTRREFRSVLDAFLSSWISSRGPYVEKFEQEFRSFIGAQHGVAVSNGTVALHLALVALNVGPGDEVIVPDITFAATINAVIYCGATPVIVDVDPQTWGLSVATVEKACTERTKAILPVHLYGRPVEIGPLVDFARRRGIVVVEDCAEAHGARYAGRPIGNFGDISCFSFYANKIVTTGEGGMCLTSSDEIAKSLRILRDHGITPNRSYWHERVGYNYRITNLQAAIGHSQLWRIEDTLARNAEIAAMYREALRGIPGVRFPSTLDPIFQQVVWLACVQVPAHKRTELLTTAFAAEIEMRPFFHSLSTLPPYEKYGRTCPVSLELAATGVNLPTSRSVDAQVVERVAKVFRDVLL